MLTDRPPRASVGELLNSSAVATERIQEALKDLTDALRPVLWSPTAEAQAATETSVNESPLVAYTRDHLFTLYGIERRIRDLTISLQIS
jgi:hypothetical protein